jgi:ketosteroid isomerase-like protein
MKKLFIIFLLAYSVSIFATNDTLEIRNVLEKQSKDWNNHDLEAFMETYWNSDSLRFVSRSGITYGWKNVLERYKASYNTPEKMGVLTFNLLHFDALNQVEIEKVYQVTGRWQVVQKEDKLEGFFTLILKKINGQWKIICDHTS